MSGRWKWIVGLAILGTLALLLLGDRRRVERTWDDATTSAGAAADAWEDAAPVRVPRGSIFDSSEHPRLSEVTVMVTGLFLPDSGMALVDRTEGRVWNPATYLAVGDDGDFDTIAAASGNEMYLRPKRSSDVVFGHRTLEAVAGEHLIIADTKREAIAVLDLNGGGVAEVPMAPGLRLTAAEVQAGREENMAAIKRLVDGMKRRAAASGQTLARNLDRFYDPRIMGDWPANEVAPAVDTVLTDYDARLWIRDYRLPGQDSVTWRVWDIDEAEILFTARMDARDALLDARGDLILLRRMDEFDVPRAVIRQLADAAH